MANDMGPGVSNSLTTTPFWNLTDVTLADENTNSIPTDYAKIVPQVCISYKFGLQVASFANRSKFGHMYKLCLRLSC